MGNPEATEAQMQQALRDACADFVFRHPKGLDAPCSEAGGGLSEGQAQRIAIARALLNTGCILIFDEATSALDAETERKVLQNIARARQHQTMLFITHRPEVMRYASHQLHIE
ncbi:MAG: ATP-binding cassette domain-containing protein, partial [Alloprevotella sp.]